MLCCTFLVAYLICKTITQFICKLTVNRTACAIASRQFGFYQMKLRHLPKENFTFGLVGFRHSMVSPWMRHCAVNFCSRSRWIKGRTFIATLMLSPLISHGNKFMLLSLQTQSPIRWSASDCHFRHNHTRNTEFGKIYGTKKKRKKHAQDHGRAKKKLKWKMVILPKHVWHQTEIFKINHFDWQTQRKTQCAANCSDTKKSY